MNWLQLAPWLIALAGLIGGGGYGLYERGEVAKEKAAFADFKTKQATAVVSAQQKAMQDSADILKDQALKLGDIHAETVTALSQVRNAPTTDTCGPSVRGAAERVYERYNPGAGQPQAR